MAARAKVGARNGAKFLKTWAPLPAALVALSDLLISSWRRHPLRIVFPFQQEALAQAKASLPRYQQPAGTPFPAFPIYVISLARAEERRAAAKKQLLSHGVNFTFFDAVDGGRRPLPDADVSRGREPAVASPLLRPALLLTAVMPIVCATALPQPIEAAPSLNRSQPCFCAGGVVHKRAALAGHLR